MRYKALPQHIEGLGNVWIVADTHDDEFKCPIFETQAAAELAARNMNQHSVIEQAFQFVNDNDADHPERTEQNRLDAVRWMMDNGASLVQVKFFLDFVGRK
jgi:hypothetical protein